MNKPVAQGLFTETENGPSLLGSRCPSCVTYYFPRSETCNNPQCAGKKTDDAIFGSQGTIYSYTIQYYPPPPPFRYDEPFTPNAIALVELPEGLRVVGMVTTDDPENLKVGMDVDLVIEPMYTDPDGSQVLTWKFRPRSAPPGSGEEERN